MTPILHGIGWSLVGYLIHQEGNRLGMPAGSQLHLIFAIILISL